MAPVPVSRRQFCSTWHLYVPVPRAPQPAQSSEATTLAIVTCASFVGATSPTLLSAELKLKSPPSLHNRSILERILSPRGCSHLFSSLVNISCLLSSKFKLPTLSVKPDSEAIQPCLILQWNHILVKRDASRPLAQDSMRPLTW